MDNKNFNVSKHKDLEEVAIKPVSTVTIKSQKDSPKRSKSIICLCLSDDILSTVIEFPSAYEVFRHLCAPDKQNGRGSRVRAPFVHL